MLKTEKVLGKTEKRYMYLVKTEKRKNGKTKKFMISPKLKKYNFCFLNLNSGK